MSDDRTDDRTDDLSDDRLDDLGDGRLDRRTGLYLAGRAAATESDTRQFRREALDGRGRRMRRGVFTTTGHWTGLTSRERHLAEIRAVVETRRRSSVVSHQSAAALWGIPLADEFSAAVHLLVPPESTARSKNGVTVHRVAVRHGDVVEFDGMLVTSPVRTVLDLARTTSFANAVVALDHALNPRSAAPWVVLTADALAEQLHGSPSARGQAKASRAIRFARPNSDNPGETLSRVAISELGFPDPLLQTRHRNPRGGYYYTDFEWPRFRVIGELDGAGKYLKDEFLRGLTPGQAVVEEKIREDHLRAEGNVVARWSPSDARTRQSLFRILSAAGLPVLR